MTRNSTALVKLRMFPGLMYELWYYIVSFSGNIPREKHVPDRKSVV